MPTATKRKPAVKRKPTSSYHPPVKRRKPTPKKRTLVYHMTPAEEYDLLREPDRVDALAMYHGLFGLTSLSLVALWILTMVVVSVPAHPNLVDLLMAILFGLNTVLHLVLVHRVKTA